MSGVLKLAQRLQFCLLDSPLELPGGKGKWKRDDTLLSLCGSVNRSDVTVLKPADVVSRLAKGACQGPLSPAGLICSGL